MEEVIIAIGSVMGGIILVLCVVMFIASSKKQHNK